MKEVRDLLRDGYARELVLYFLNLQTAYDIIVEGAELDAGDMFRALVLDEQISVDQAAAVYYEAIEAIADFRAREDA